MIDDYSKLKTFSISTFEAANQIRKSAEFDQLITYIYLTIYHMRMGDLMSNDPFYPSSGISTGAQNIENI